MSSVTPIEDKKERTATDAYDEVSLKLERLKSITVLIRASDSDHIHPEELTGIGYALENMVDGIQESVDGLYNLGGAS